MTSRCARSPVTPKMTNEHASGFFCCAGSSAMPALHASANSVQRRHGAFSTTFHDDGAVIGRQLDQPGQYGASGCQRQARSWRSGLAPEGEDGGGELVGALRRQEVSAAVADRAAL